MTPEGYAIILENGHFILRYYPNVNYKVHYQQVAMSFNYDGIMKALLMDREMRGMEKEYWIS